MRQKYVVYQVFLCNSVNVGFQWPPCSILAGPSEPEEATTITDFDRPVNSQSEGGQGEIMPTTLPSPRIFISSYGPA